MQLQLSSKTRGCGLASRWPNDLGSFQVRRAHVRRRLVRRATQRRREPHPLARPVGLFGFDPLLDRGPFGLAADGQIVKSERGLECPELLGRLRARSLLVSGGGTLGNVTGVIGEGL